MQGYEVASGNPLGFVEVVAKPPHPDAAKLYWGLWGPLDESAMASSTREPRCSVGISPRCRKKPPKRGPEADRASSRGRCPPGTSFCDLWFRPLAIRSWPLGLESICLVRGAARPSRRGSSATSEAAYDPRSRMVLGPLGPSEAHAATNAEGATKAVSTGSPPRRPRFGQDPLYLVSSSKISPDGVGCSRR